MGEDSDDGHGKKAKKEIDRGDKEGSEAVAELGFGENDIGYPSKIGQKDQEVAKKVACK